MNVECLEEFDVSKLLELDSFGWILTRRITRQFTKTANHVLRLV